MSDEEEDEEDEFFGDTFSEKSCDVEDDEVDNDEFDNVLNEELKHIHEKKNLKLAVPDDDDRDMDKFDRMLAEELKVPSSVTIQKEVTVATTKNEDKEVDVPLLPVATTKKVDDDDSVVYSIVDGFLVKSHEVEHDKKDNKSFVESDVVVREDENQSADSSDEGLKSENITYNPNPEEGSTMIRLSAEETWKRKKVIEDQKRLLNQPLDHDDPLTFLVECERCYGTQPGTLTVYDHFRDIEYKYSDRMFCCSFVDSFLHLIAHDAHKIKAPYPTTGVVFKAVTSESRKKPPRVQHLADGVTNLVSIAFGDAHFVVLNMDIKKRNVMVLDGLNYSIKKWKNHVVYMLMEHGLVPMDAHPKFHYEGKKKGKMVMKIEFQNSEQWILENEEVVKQTDGISCGPLACFRILLLFGYENLLCKKVLNDYKQMRITVMDYWNAMLERNKSDMYTLVVGRKYTQAQEVLEAVNESEKVKE